MSDKLTKDLLHLLNQKQYKALDRYLDDVLNDSELLDSKMLTVINKFLKDNDITAVEKDAKELEKKRSEVVQRQREIRQQGTPNNLEFFDKLKERKYG